MNSAAWRRQVLQAEHADLVMAVNRQLVISPGEDINVIACGKSKGLYSALDIHTPAEAPGAVRRQTMADRQMAH